MNDISVDERDIFSYIDLEQYIIERNYLLSFCEYELIKASSYSLQCVSVIEKKESPELLNVQMFYETPDHFFFNCWTNVSLSDKTTLRRRNIKLNKEDVNNYEDLVLYAKERNYLLTGQEFAYFIQNTPKIGIVSCNYVTKNTNNFYFYNQITGYCCMNFINDKNLTIYLKIYEEEQKERRKEEEICTLKRTMKV